MTAKTRKYRVEGPFYSDGIWFVYDNEHFLGIQDPWKRSFATRAEARRYAKKLNARHSSRRRAPSSGGAK